MKRSHRHDVIVVGAVTLSKDAEVRSIFHGVQGESESLGDLESRAEQAASTGGG